jgi:curli production assembly/transport component CsgF
MLNKKVIGVASLMLMGSFFPLSVQASPTNFTFTNPSFGGSPLNGSYFLALTEAQKKFKAKEKEQTVADQFKDQFQSRVLGALVTKVVDELQGNIGKPGDSSGTFEVAGIKVRYEVIGNNVTLFVNDGLTETSLTVPRTVFTSSS